MSVYLFPGGERLYLGTMASAYEAINKPQYMLNDLPGAHRAVLSGPIDHHITEGMATYLQKLFGPNGLTVELTPEHSPDGPMHFRAHFTGEAYDRLKTSQRAHEAAYPTAIGH